MQFEMNNSLNRGSKNIIITNDMRFFENLSAEKVKQLNLVRIDNFHKVCCLS